MADIFISYKSTDRERVAPVVALLQAQGWSVWSDTRIGAGETWDEVIERELERANCVIVFWSADSVRSRWVRAEASEGLERGILIPIHIDVVKPQLEFNRVQSVDLTAWQRQLPSPAAEALVVAVAKLLGSPRASTTRFPSPVPKNIDPPRVLHPKIAGYAKEDVLVAAAATRIWPEWGNVPFGTVPAVAIVLLVAVSSLVWLQFPSPTGREVAAPRAQAAPEPRPAIRPRLVDPSRDAVLTQAAERVETGDVVGARELLAGANDGTQGSILFALAETYDTNMLAAWGVRGVTADVAKARALYRKALSLGYSRAQTRLDALK